MWKHLMGRRAQVIGLDIQDTGIHIVELTGWRTPKLARYAQLPAVSEVALSAHLRAAWQTHGFSQQTVALALSESSVRKHRFVIPTGLRGDLIELRVYRELQQLFPQVTDLYIDYEIYPLVHPDQMEVRVVASVREPIDRHIATLKEAGLCVLVVDLEHSAYERAFRRIRDSSAPWEGLWEVQGSTVLFQVFYQGKSHYKRALQFPAALGSAEQTLEIERNMWLFYDLHPEVRLQRLFIAGDSPTFDSQLLGLPVVWADPFVSLQDAQKSQPLASPSACFLRSTGLALHGYSP